MGGSVDVAGRAFHRPVPDSCAAGIARDRAPGIARRGCRPWRWRTSSLEAREHVVVGPLPADEAAALAGGVAGRPAGPLLLQQVAGAGGNPLFVIELVRALDEDGALELGDGRAEARRASLPPTLRLTILRRLSRLRRTC